MSIELVPIEINETYREYLHRAMKINKISQRTAADRTNKLLSKDGNTVSITQSFVSDLIRGELPPRTLRERKTASQDPRYFALAKVVGMDAVEFVRLIEQVQVNAAFPSAWSTLSLGESRVRLETEGGFAERFAFDGYYRCLVDASLDESFASMISAFASDAASRLPFAFRANAPWVQAAADRIASGDVAAVPIVGGILEIAGLSPVGHALIPYVALLAFVAWTDDVNGSGHARMLHRLDLLRAGISVDDWVPRPHTDTSCLPGGDGALEVTDGLNRSYWNLMKKFGIQPISKPKPSFISQLRLVRASTSESAQP